MKNKHPTFEDIEKMIEDEFRLNPLIEDIQKYQVPEFDNEKKYKHLLKLDFEKKLDDEKELREYIKQAVREHVIDVFIENINEMRDRYSKVINLEGV